MILKLRLLLLNMLGPLMISEHRLVVSSLWNEVAVDRAREMPVLMEIVDF